MLLRIKLLPSLLAILLLCVACARTPAAALPTSTPNLPSVKLEIRSVPDAARYDKTELAVPAGTRVTLEFHNGTGRGERIMQNWVLVQPGSEDGVVADAPTLTLADSFVAKSDTRVIAYSIAIVGSQSTELVFNAPPPGRYTYLSTTPRYYGMRGVLSVR